jgi:hypothetical protein
MIAQSKGMMVTDDFFLFSRSVGVRFPAPHDFLFIIDV